MAVCPYPTGRAAALCKALHAGYAWRAQRRGQRPVDLEAPTHAVVLWPCHMHTCMGRARMHACMQAHKSALRSLSVSGSRFVSASKNGRVLLWDASGEMSAEARPTEITVRCAALRYNAVQYSTQYRRMTRRTAAHNASPCTCSGLCPRARMHQSSSGAFLCPHVALTDADADADACVRSLPECCGTGPCGRALMRPARARRPLRHHGRTGHGRAAVRVGPGDGRVRHGTAGGEGEWGTAGHGPCCLSLLCVRASLCRGRRTQCNEAE